MILDELNQLVAIANYLAQLVNNGNIDQKSSHFVAKMVPLINQKIVVLCQNPEFQNYLNNQSSKLDASKTETAHQIHSALNKKVSVKRPTIMKTPLKTPKDNPYEALTPEHKLGQ